MINWGGFELFFKTGIPSVVFNTSIIIMAVAIVAGILFNRIKNKRKYTLWVLFIEYLFIVICSTVICRETPSFEYTRLEMMPFWTYKAVMAHTPWISVWDIVLNVVLFLPFGFFVKLLYPSISLFKLMMLAFIYSFCIEIEQYFFEKGIAQIDDILHNVLGAIIGCYIAKLTILGVIKVSS